LSEEEIPKMIRKRLVYIPTYHYLSHPIFFALAIEAREEFHNVYLNTNDPLFASTNREGIRREQILKHFDEYQEVYPPRLGMDGSSAGIGLMNFIFAFRKFNRELFLILDSINPDAVLTTSDMGGYVNRSCNIWCEKNRVPFIVIQPSPAMEPGRKNIKDKLKGRLFYALFNLFLSIPLFRRQDVFGNERQSNYLFLQGEYFKEDYRGLDIENKIRIVGNPALDNILSGKYPRADLRSLGLEEAKNFQGIATICTEGFIGLLDQRIIDGLHDLYRYVVAQNPDIFFVVKVHPRESTEAYEKLFQKLSNNNHKIIKYIDLYKLFTVTDVQISVASTTSLEAIVFGIPIVLANPNGEIRLMDFFDGSIELRAKTGEELSQSVRKCLSKDYRASFEGKREKFLRSRYGFLDGMCSKRTIEEIKEIIDSAK
jgi:hypothetical protein